MMHQAKDLSDLTIVASDGSSIGAVTDLYFDDQAWTIRYLVVDVGSWLARRKVLISPLAAGEPDWAAKVLPVALTRKQIRNSPDIDTNKPVTRQHESDYFAYYNYPYYWGGMGLMGAGLYPPMLLVDGTSGEGRAEADQANSGNASRAGDHDHHLRSTKAVRGYHIDAIDGEIGHVADLLVDEANWSIRYLVVSTGNWWLGHDVLLTPPWIKSVSWEKQSMAVDVTRDALKRAPCYDRASPLTRDLEVAVHQHYGRPAYW